MKPEEKRNFTEKLHREYLIRKLNLNSMEPGGFDFSSKRHFLELKSRLCLFNAKGQVSNIWWALSEPQIKDYEERYESLEMDFLWILVHGLTRRPCRELNSKKQIRDSIYHRDIFIAPWEVYKLSPLGKEGENTKTGPYRHISRKKLAKLVELYPLRLEGGTLYLPKQKGLEYLIKK